MPSWTTPKPYIEKAGAGQCRCGRLTNQPMIELYGHQGWKGSSRRAISMAAPQLGARRILQRRHFPQLLSGPTITATGYRKVPLSPAHRQPTLQVTTPTMGRVRHGHGHQRRESPPRQRLPIDSYGFIRPQLQHEQLRPRTRQDKGDIVSLSVSLRPKPKLYGQ